MLSNPRCTDISQDQILKSGSLNKKAQRTKRWIKHWFVLKNDALSWYQSSAVSSSFVFHCSFLTHREDPYFPHGIVDLRYAISCDPYGEKGFRLRTNNKTITLWADSVPSREEWVKAIRKVIFKVQNMGDSVKVITCLRYHVKQHSKSLRLPSHTLRYSM